MPTRSAPNLLVVVCLCITVGQTPSQAQYSCVDMHQDYARAMDYLNAFSNDSANLIFTGLIEQLSAAGTLDSPLGLKVRLRQAEVLEKDEQDETAIQKLLSVVEDSRKQHQWAVYANAHLSLARLHEKMDRPYRCLQSLNLAGHIVETEALDSIYPRLCIRWSSYHRIFSDQDSALYYAREVIRTAPGLGQRDHEGTGHLLMGMLLAKKDRYEESASHYMRAGNLFKANQNFCGYGFILGNLSKLHLRNGHVDLALSYNDSFLIVGRRAISNGYDSTIVMSYYHKGRTAAFEAMGGLDSTLYHLKAFHKLELKRLQQSNLDEVVAVEARYYDEKKTQKIKEQGQLLQYEKARQNGLLFLIGLTLIFTAVLAYLYWKLRVANQKTKRQALTIQKTNEELSRSLEQEIMLQGEIHHRVKNNLQVIISLLDLQREDITDARALEGINSMSNRIYSMAAIHELLYQGKGTDRVNLKNYIQHLCDHFRQFAAEDHAPVFSLEVPNRPFNLETMMPIGIMLNELMTNSLKYAVLPGQPLIIDIQIQPCADGFCLRYQDNGLGFSRGMLKGRNGGLGAYLLKSMIRQLQGRLKTHNEDGAVYQIFFKEKNKKESYEFVSHLDR